MNKYAREIETSKQDASEFKILIDNLVTAFIYRPIIVQTVIQILVCRMKDGIATEVKKIADQSNESSNAQSNCPASKNKDSNMTPTTAPLIQRACYAYKCRILQAKGILQRNMFLVANRNMCSGCITESLRHKKNLQLEHELLQDSSSNTILAQIPVLLLTGTTLKQFRRTLQHLPTLANKKRDDPIYGAARYLANSIGFFINDATSQESLDAPMTAAKNKTYGDKQNFIVNAIYNMIIYRRMVTGHSAMFALI